MDLDSIDSLKYVTDYAVYTIQLPLAMRHGWMARLGKEDKLVVPIKFWTIEFKKGGESGQ